MYIQRLHVGKASGSDDLSSEHYAHPLVVVQLCSLFRIMVIHDLVPDNIGNCIIIPLLKDKNGNVDSLDNYHAITLIPMISSYQHCSNSLFYSVSQKKHPRHF